MRKYTIEEISAALAAGEGCEYGFGDTDRQRVLKNPYLTRKLRELQQAGDELRNMRTRELRFSAFKHFETDGDRAEFESDPEDGYFVRRRKLAVFGILSWLYGRAEDISELEDVLWAICSEYTWALPAHLSGKGLEILQTDGTFNLDLFAAETGEGIAEILDLMGDSITPIVRQRCLHELKRRVLDRCTEPFSWNTTLTSNWVCVCNGNSGIAALYAERDPQRLAEIITSCANAIQNYHESITADGACSEGLGYWAYGFGNYIYFADMLKRRTAGLIDLMDNEKMRRTANFGRDCLLPNGQYVSFADMWGRELFYVLPGLMSHICNIYPGTKLAGFELMDLSFPGILRLRFGRELREFIWVSDRLEALICEDTEPRIYPDAGLYIATASSGVSLAAKAGHNDEPHNHNDVGSFMMVKNGVRILDDIGASEYTRDYFISDTRYTKHFAPSSQAHSLPIINGCGQVEGREHCAADVEITADRFRADIAGAYADATLKSLIRTIDFDRDTGRAVLTDDMHFTEAPTSVIERFISPMPPVQGDGYVSFADGGQELRLKFEASMFSVSISQVTDMQHDPLMERVTYITDLILTAPAAETKLQFIIE